MGLHSKSQQAARQGHSASPQKRYQSRLGPPPIAVPARPSPCLPSTNQGPSSSLIDLMGQTRAACIPFQPSHRPVIHSSGAQGVSRRARDIADKCIGHGKMYNETLRRSPYSDHEEPAAKT